MSVLYSWNTIIQSHKTASHDTTKEHCIFEILFWQLYFSAWQDGLYFTCLILQYENETKLLLRLPISSWFHCCLGRLISLFNLQFQHVVWDSAWEQAVQPWNVELFLFRVHLWTASNGFCLHLLTYFFHYISKFHNCVHNVWIRLHKFVFFVKQWMPKCVN